MSLDINLYAVPKCPHCGNPCGARNEVFDANLTHNLIPMANAADLYETLWAPRLLTDPEVAKVVRDADQEWRLRQSHERYQQARDIESSLPTPTARLLIEPLRAGLAKLIADPALYQTHNPNNGWGSYDGLVRVVTDYLAACEAHPDAEVEISR